jgi:hypothetical protein
MPNPVFFGLVGLEMSEVEEMCGNIYDRFKKKELDRT